MHLDLRRAWGATDMTRLVTCEQTTWRVGWCLVVFLAAATPATARSQADGPADARWLPWLGCWQLVEETGPMVEDPDGISLVADRVVVCLTPTEASSGADPGGVEVTTMADGEPVLTATLRADDTQHPVTEASCTGWRRNTWSGDGARLFARAELSCADGADSGNDPRLVSGVGFMTSASNWLDIQLVSSGDRGEVTVRRYRRASEATTLEAGGTPPAIEVLERARTAARLASSSELSVDDVIEAGTMLHPAVVEAMVVESRASFAIDGRTLIRLADAGVSTELIDLMVALSFPDEFVVGRSPARATASYGGGGGGYADQFIPYGFGYDAWYPYYASPFGYYYGWSPYSSLYYLGPSASYAIFPGGLAPAAVGGRSPGRAYQGRGYSQVGVRQPAIERRAQPRNRGTGTTSSQGASRGGTSGRSGSSGGGQATPGGYSRGGSSGRTATPRDR